jgi:hypothetical protein
MKKIIILGAALALFTGAQGQDNEGKETFLSRLKRTPNPWKDMNPGDKAIIAGSIGSGLYALYKY